MATSRRIKQLMRPAQKRVTRLARACRTRSYAAVIALAKVSLLEFVANAHAGVYRQVRVICVEEANLMARVVSLIRLQERRRVIRE